jgi:hypothetical protein
MNDERQRTALRRVLLLISDHLRIFSGDELALERLSAYLEQDFGGEDLRAAVLTCAVWRGRRGGAIAALQQARSLLGACWARARGSLSPEAWAICSISSDAARSEQFERVLDRLAAAAATRDRARRGGARRDARLRQRAAGETDMAH